MSTTEHPSPPRSPSTLPRNPSLTSLISFSVMSATSEKKPHHTLITAPCSRCGHAEPIKSLLSVVEKSILRCPSCTDDNNTVATTDGVVSKTMLHKSFADLESTLKRHGADLDRLSILPRPTALKELDDGNKLRDDSASVRSLTVLASEPESQNIEYAQSIVPHKSNRSSYAGGYPLVNDVEDLKQLTAGVTRLLKTLHDKVNRLDLEERLLRSEREELSKEREDVNRLRKVLEREGGFGGDGARSPESAKGAGPPSLKDRMSKSFELGDDYQDGRSLALSRTMSFATDDYNRPEIVWNEEKEQQLTDLEKRLVRANRNWSDEQEDVLPLVERLREERRKAKKLAAGDESPRKTRGGSFSFVSRRDSKSRRNSVGEEKKERIRRGSAGDENKARGGLMRFFTKREAA